MEIRVGDVVRLKDCKVSAVGDTHVSASCVFLDRDGEIRCSGAVFPISCVNYVLKQEETDAEKIVRIEREKADIKNAYDTLDKMHQEVLARVKELEAQVKWQIEKAEIENKVNMEAMFGALKKNR
jgi:hypothetical protein